MIGRNIKVLVVDDSMLFRNVLKQELMKDPAIDVVGTAVDPIDAEYKIAELKPDILTLDVEMPKMDGITFLKKLMKEKPIKVVLVSSLNISVFDALAAGAVDFVKKPDMSNKNDLANFFDDLRDKVKVAKVAKIKTSAEVRPTRVSTPSELTKMTLRLAGNMGQRLLAIGASTGGTEATLEVLKRLPADIPPTVITQHMPPGFTKMYADRLNRICKMEVREAQDGDRLKQGLALVAPGDKQMRLAKDSNGYYVSCKVGEKVSGHCPSVDVLFESVATAAGRNAIGVILTGMGKDGADSLLKMRKAGAFTIGQDQASCVVYGMPKVAFDIGAVQVQSTITEVSDVIIKELNKK